MKETKKLNGRIIHMYVVSSIMRDMNVDLIELYDEVWITHEQHCRQCYGLISVCNNFICCECYTNSVLKIEKI